MISDRDRRLMRARTRLAVAAQILELAITDAAAVRDDIGEVIDKGRRSLVWAAQELGRELEQEEEPKP